nr:MAG TPA: minor capsid protein 2 [Siphoviridae sp. ct8LQ5]
MISAAEFAAYNRAVAKMGDRAASDVEAAVLAWCRAHGGATVAEKREAAKLIMEGFVQGYDDVAAEFAAQWYDDLAEREGARLQQAVTMTTYRPESVDTVARYQAKKLVKGGDGAFARACGEYARNDALRSLNETIISNVGRDRSAGVRFARVPTGFETCTFCIMLASRGAVYHTRKSAGEFKHFHRHCDCKVVPGFEDDPDAELVEGVRPEELRDLYVRFKEIDDYGLPRIQEDALKHACLDWFAAQSGGQRMPSSELSEIFEAARRDAWNRFAREKTERNYEATFGEFVRLLGEEYGATWECGSIRNAGGTAVYAGPNGDELWVAAMISPYERFIKFLPSDQDIVPDIQTSLGYAEIKCPTSAKKISARLRHAKAQLEAGGSGEKATYLGLQKVNDVDRARAIAADMQSGGTAVNVWCILPDGQVARP